MAIVETGFFLYPPQVVHSTDRPIINVGVLAEMDAATERLAVVFMAPRSGIINRVALRTGNVTLNAASVVRFSLQDTTLVSSLRVPDGIQDQFRDHDNSVVLDNTIIETGLLTDDGTDGGAKRTVVTGDMIAFVIEFETFNTSDLIRMGILTGADEEAGYANVNNHANPLVFNGSSWSKAGTVNTIAMLAIEYQTDGWFGIHPQSVLAQGYTTLLSTDGNEEAGNRVRVPFKCQVAGVQAGVESGADAFLRVYDASETLIAEGVAEVLEGGTVVDSIEMLLDSPVILEANTDYFFVWAGEVGNAISVLEWSLTDAKFRNAMPWKGWAAVSRADFTTDPFSESPTDVHDMYLVISGIDVVA